MEIKQLLEKTRRGIMCFQSFSLSMAQKVFRRFLGPLSSKMTGRQTVIAEGLTSNVLLNSLQSYSRTTERGIALRNSIIWNSCDCMVHWKGLKMSKTHQRHYNVRRWSAPYTSRCSLLLIECSHMIDNLHVERNKDDVSSHVKSIL